MGDRDIKERKKYQRETRERERERERGREYVCVCKGLVYFCRKVHLNIRLLN